MDWFTTPVVVMLLGSDCIVTHPRHPHHYLYSGDRIGYVELAPSFYLLPFPACRRNPIWSSMSVQSYLCKVVLLVVRGDVVVCVVCGGVVQSLLMLDCSSS